MLLVVLGHGHCLLFMRQGKYLLRVTTLIFSILFHIENTCKQPHIVSKTKQINGLFQIGKNWIRGLQQVAQELPVAHHLLKCSSKCKQIS